jgi:hypothetical protein
MRLTSRSGLIATTLAIGAIAAPSAQAGGMAGGLRLADPPGAAQHEAQNFKSLYHLNGHTNPVQRPTSSVPSNGFDFGDAAIGASVAGGVALLMTGGALGVRRRGQLRHP